jgi:hypothetical protein
MKRCQTARTMASRKLVPLVISGWVAVGDAKFFGNDNVQRRATCLARCSHDPSLFHFELKWVEKFNAIQILATWGGHSWNGLTTDKRSVGHVVMAQLFRWLTNGPPPPSSCFANFEMASFGRPVAFSHLQFFWRSAPVVPDATTSDAQLRHKHSLLMVMA